VYHEFGWMSALRKPSTSNNAPTFCRWIHISSKCPEYIYGVLLGLSDWHVDPEAKMESLRQVERCIYENERFSKHGRYFSPFFHPLSPTETQQHENSPVLLSLPFLDWTIHPGPTPPLRFQVDEREDYYSTRSASHPLRSILQHYYRLEDTTDRERTQVFMRHRPWASNRDMDLKIRRW